MLETSMQDLQIKIDSKYKPDNFRKAISPMGSMQLAASLLSASLGLMPAFQSIGLEVMLSTPAAMPML